MRSTFTLILSFLALQSFAQLTSSPLALNATNLQEPTGNVITSKEKTPETEVFRKNIVKMNLSSLALDNYSLSYERSLTRKITFVAGYRFMPETNVTSMFLVNKAIEKELIANEDVIEHLGLATVANNTYTGELRFYAGEHPGARGFYVSLYGRHMDLQATYPHEHETDNNTYTLPFNGSMKGFGGGLMFGAQWLIAKRVTFDWYIVGAHYGKLTLDAPAVADLSTMTQEEKQELKEDLESVNDHFNGKANLQATVTDQGAQLTGDAPFAGIRGFGFSLGIAF